MPDEKKTSSVKRYAGGLAVFLLLAALRVAAQSRGGELWVKVIDPQGAGVPADVRLECGAESIRNLEADALGDATLHNVPLGDCRLEVNRAGFDPASQTIAGGFIPRYWPAPHLERSYISRGLRRHIFKPTERI